MDFKKLFLAVVFPLAFSFVFGQTLSVVSHEDGEPLPGARVDIEWHEQVAHYQTQIDGKLKIDPQFSEQTTDLTISYIGYKTKTIKGLTLSKDTTIRLSSGVKRLDEVAITAQYKSQTIENTVHNIRIIDNKKIEAMAAQNVEDVLSNELNVRIGEDNVLGSTMQLQGVGGQNVKILVDGVPLTGRMNGNIDLSQIPIECVERIEIVEGPLSVNYGTDALGGTINIITKKNQRKKWELISSNYLESSGKLNNSGAVGYRTGNHQIRLNGGRKFFDGWDPSHGAFHYETHPVADSSRVQLWNPKIQIFGGVNYRYSGKKATFNYSGQILNEDIINKGYPRAPYQEMAFDDYYNTKRVNQRAYFNYRFKNHYRMSILAGYNGFFRRKTTKVRDLTTITDIPSADPNAHDTSQFHSFNSRGRFIQAHPDKKINYEIGYDIIYEIANGKRIAEGKQTIGDYALYATAEYTPIASLILRPGLRYGYNTGYKSPVTPSLNIKYDFLKKTKHKLSIRASYARGFRSPTVKELHYEFIDINHHIVGNPNLRAERSNQLNLSFHQYLDVNSIRWRNKIGFFYTDIHNLITLAQEATSSMHYTYFNLDRYTTTGIQIESNLIYKNLSAGLGFGLVGRNNNLKTENEELTGFLYSPEATFNLQYDWKKTGLQFALFYKYTGALPNIYSNEDGEIVEGKMGDYNIADVSISKYIFKHKLKITVGVKNLFNVTSINGSAGMNQGAHSSGSGIVSIGMGRTYNLGVILHINSK